jgi:predicted ATPase/DNA-binding winged helix-turn-helix (wHTH) protein
VIHKSSSGHGFRSKSLSFGRFTLLLDERSLLRDGAAVSIGSRAFDILSVLASRAGEVIGNKELVALVWPDTFVEETNLRVHIAALRKALGEHGAGLSYIANIPGRGYCFTSDVTSTQAAVRESGGASRGLPGRLPLAIGRVIGRDDAVRQLCNLFSERRLVTIVGSGGIGKTTIAVQAAWAIAGNYPDGAVFVDLSQLRHPASMAALVAAALGQVLSSGDEIKELGEMLGSRSMLIVLDNCEHLLDGSAMLAEALLRAGPGIHLLATSREPLMAESEWVQRLASLEFPLATSKLTAAEALSYSAVQLFVERASASLGGFVLTDDEAASAAEICRRLDGVALAIELAAGRLSSAGLAGLARSLDDRLNVLTRGRRTALPRHQTLRATLDWSYELLSLDEQRVFRALAIFTGFNEQAVASVIPGRVTLQSVEDILVSLTAKSLVAVDLSRDLGSGPINL